MAFNGTFDHTLDAKHRLTIPAAFREELSGSVMLAARSELKPGAPRAVAIWKPDAYQAYVDGALAGLNRASTKRRELEMYFRHFSFETELDSANRVMIPPHLLQYAGLARDVAVTGSGDCVDVWDRDRYGEVRRELLDRIPNLLESLDHTS